MRRDAECSLPMPVRVGDKSSEGCVKKANHTRDNWRVRMVNPPPKYADLKQAASSRIYVGNPYHKSYPSSARMPRIRPGTTKCPIHLKDRRELIGCWLRNALMSGQVGALWKGVFPRYPWYHEDDIVYKARQGSPGSGEYHGYPPKPDRIVRGLS